MDTASHEPPPTGRKRSRYTKQPANLDSLTVKHQKGKTTRELGQEYGVAHTTIQRWLDQHQLEQQGVQRYRTNRAEVFARIQAKSLSLQEALIADLEQDRLSGLLTPSQKAGMLQSLNVVAGTLYDKERLETGQSTQNLSVMSKLIDSAVSDIYKPLKDKGSRPHAPQEGAGVAEVEQVRQADVSD